MYNACVLSARRLARNNCRVRCRTAIGWAWRHRTDVRPITSHVSHYVLNHITKTIWNIKTPKLYTVIALIYFDPELYYLSGNIFLFLKFIHVSNWVCKMLCNGEFDWHAHARCGQATKQKSGIITWPEIHPTNRFFYNGNTFFFLHTVAESNL